MFSGFLSSVSILTLQTFSEPLFVFVNVTTDSVFSADRKERKNLQLQ